MSAEDEMLEGYLDGFNDVRLNLPDGSNRSPAYKHGWQNGRDDRLNSPRERASVLRSMAQMILNVEAAE